MKYSNLLSRGYFSDTNIILEDRKEKEMKIKGPLGIEIRFSHSFTLLLIHQTFVEKLYHKQDTC